MIFIAVIAVCAVELIIYTAFAFSKSKREQTSFEQVFPIVILSAMLIGCGALGLIGGEMIPVIIVPFLLFFFACIYAAKEDRAKQYELLEEIKEKLEKTEEEIAALKSEFITGNGVETDDESHEETESNSDEG